MTRLIPRRFRRRRDTHVVTITLDITPWFRALDAANETLKSFAAAMRRFAEMVNAAQPPPILRHSFRPDYDLACTVCQLTPEAHP